MLGYDLYRIHVYLFISFQYSDVDTVLRTKKPKETVPLPEVVVDKESREEQKERTTSQEEEEPMVQGEESSKPEVIYLVSF